MHGETAMKASGVCGATTRSGGTCKRPRGWGTDHTGWGNCKNHGGSTPDGIRYAASERATAEGGHMAMGRRVEPIDALLHVVYSTAGRVEWLGEKVALIDAEKMLVDTPRGQDLTAYAKLHGLELDRLARVSKMALDAGVAERVVRMAERTATLIGAAAEDALRDLSDGAPPEVAEWLSQTSVRGEYARRFAGRLQVLEATSDDEPVAALPSVG